MTNQDLLDEIRIIQSDVKKILTDVAALKIQAGIFGGIAGAVGSAIISIFIKHL